jgi:exodeoxyribonuclease VII large subunit
MELLNITERLETSVVRRLEAFKQAVGRNAALLEAVSPLKVISKGYSAVYTDDGKLLKNVGGAKVGDNVTFRLSDGRVGATVNSVMIDKE